MINLDVITNEHNEEYNFKWPYISDPQYRMLIIRGSESGKTNAFLNLIKEKDSKNLIDKSYLYAKYLNKPKYFFIINKHKGAGIKHLNDPKAFIDHSASMNDVYKCICDYIPTRKRKICV